MTVSTEILNKLYERAAEILKEEFPSAEYHEDYKGKFTNYRGPAISGMFAGPIVTVALADARDERMSAGEETHFSLKDIVPKSMDEFGKGHIYY